MPVETAEPPQNSYAETDSKIDALFEGDAPQAPEPKPATPEPAAPAAPPAAPPTEKAPPTEDQFSGDFPRPTPKQAAPAKPPAAPPSPQPEPDNFKTPKELREAHAKEKATRLKLESEIADARKQVEAAKQAGATEAESRYRAELDQLRKEREELDTKVRYTDYTKSDEYKTKYIQPLSKTWLDVKKEIEGVTITNEDGTAVPVTEEHMMQLVRMPTVQAARQASEWFGPAASEMLGYRRKLLDLYSARDAAVEEWRTKGSELSAKQQREAEESTRTVIGRFDDEIKGLRESMPEVFTADDKNAEEKGYFDKGSAIVDVAFKGSGLKDGMTPEQKRDAIVRAQANVAAKAAAFGVVVYRLRQKDAEIEALKTKLAGYEKTEPGTGDPGRSGLPAKPAPKRPEDAIDDMTFEP